MVSTTTTTTSTTATLTERITKTTYGESHSAVIATPSALATMTRYTTSSGPASEFDLTAGSVFEDQPPASVYQTLISEGKQDSSSLLMMRVRLSDGAARACEAALRSGHSTHDLVYGGIRNFDGTDVRMYDAETKTMQYLQLPQDLFRYDLMSGSLRISVHRKYLPVSKCHGNAPFMFAFLIKPAGEVLVTTPFTVLSKEPKVPDAPKAPVKRIRRPPPKPFAAAHTDDGRAISSFLAGDVGVVAPTPRGAVTAATSVHEAPDARTPPLATRAEGTGPATAAPIVVPTDIASGHQTGGSRKRTRREAVATDRPDSPGSAMDALFAGGIIAGGGGGSGVAPAGPDFHGDDELYMEGTFGGDHLFSGSPLSEDQFQLFLGLEDAL